MKNKEYRFPHDLTKMIFLQDETDKWNNIPIPLTDTCLLFKKCFQLHGHIIKEMIRQNKLKSSYVCGIIRNVQVETADQNNFVK